MDYVYSALGANLVFLEIIGLAFIAFTLTRKLDQSKRVLSVSLILLRYLFPVILKQAFLQWNKSCTLCTLFCQAAFSIFLLVIAKTFLFNKSLHSIK